MTATSQVDVQMVIDRSAVSGTQKKALAVCLAFAIVDGFDSLITGFVVPAISRDWDVSVASLTPVTLAAVIGTIFGAMFVAPRADRLGRRPIIIGGAALFGIFTLAAAVAPNLETLAVLRFIAGVGLGAVPATLIAYGTEMAPTRLRGTLVAVIGAGLASGGFVGGFAAGFLIPVFGWRSLFVIGGVLPLLVLLVAARYLPETVQFSAQSGKRDQLVQVLTKIDPTIHIDDEEFVGVERKDAKSSNFRALFTNRRGQMTTVLWVLFLCQYMGSFFIFSWLPSVLTKAGVGDTAALFATSTCTLGGLIGGVILGVTIDRVNVRFQILAVTYAVGAVSIIVTALTTGLPLALFISLFITGFGVIGTGVCMNAVASGLYPSRIRTTAVGWFLGFGRVGSVIGPALGGLLLAMSMSSKSIFLFSAAPAAICSVCVVLLAISSRKVVPEPEPTAAIQPDK